MKLYKLYRSGGLPLFSQFLQFLQFWQFSLFCSSFSSCTVQPKNNARARSGARSSCAARPIHEEAMLHFFDNKGERYFPKPKVVATVALEDPRKVCCAQKCATGYSEPPYGTNARKSICLQLWHVVVRSRKIYLKCVYCYSVWVLCLNPS